MIGLNIDILKQAYIIGVQAITAIEQDLSVGTEKRQGSAQFMRSVGNKALLACVGLTCRLKSAIGKKQAAQSGSKQDKRAPNHKQG